MKNYGFGIAAATAAITAFSASFSATGAHADAKTFYYMRAQRMLHPMHFDQPSQTGTFDQKLDHTNAQDMRTFNQRYWINSSYAKGTDSPVLFYICGEAACSEDEMAGETLQMARKFGAYAITLEHRYYGASQPFPTLTAENMQYLTVPNALADLAEFEQWVQSSFGLTGKWISVGGSYSGSLSAYYRTLYPTMVVGSLASSAPVMALENFEDYDRHVAEVAGPQCANVMRLVVKQAEQAVDLDSGTGGATPDSSALDSIKAQFAAQKLQDPDDFLYLIADVGASAVQYGMRDQFCNSLISAAGANGTDSASAVKAYGQFAQQVYQMWGVDAWGFSSESATSTNPNDYMNGVGQRQWLYQSCTEFGYFQNAYHDPAYSVRSSRINPAYHRELCNRLFGLNQDPDTAAVNSNFYQPILQQASNILLTNGTNDPWSLLGITDANGNDVNPALTVLSIQGGAHCDDLAGTQSVNIAPAWQKFSDLATSWLNLVSSF